MRRLIPLVAIVCMSAGACQLPGSGGEVAIDECADLMASTMSTLVGPLTVVSSPTTETWAQVQAIQQEISGDIPDGCLSHRDDPAFEPMWRDRLTATERIMIDRHDIRLAF